MEQLKKIQAYNENDAWTKVSKDIDSGMTLDNYHIIISLPNRDIELDIDSDPGGGFEGGYEFSTIRTLIKDTGDFRFIIHHESFVNKIAKAFGLEDEQTGYDEFDKNIFIKTNNIDRVKEIFADKKNREAFQSLHAFSLSLKDKHDAVYLEFEIERALIDINELKNIFNSFNEIASLIEKRGNSF